MKGIGHNTGITKIDYTSEFGMSVQRYIDDCNQGAEDKNFRIIPSPDIYVSTPNGEKLAPIGNGQNLIFTIEDGKMKVTGILDLCLSDEKEIDLESLKEVA